ncbi:amidase [Actinokineospora globicatena]|uniref:amidase n=1 Tax=Actinokineospora globicatena TaxID=103729 RepID=UPI0020A562ED|nr:amidase [Actinokineospora globicatena]MCP2306441.1 amidase [Actinokineospora globicatena]GLW88659.1 amidase [Actinokineospora globicatena]
MRRVIAVLGLAVLASVVPGPVASASGLGFDLDRATIPQLQRLMDRGALSAVRLTQAYLDRIKTVDKKVNAVLKVDETAIAQAKASDQRRRSGHTRGPLDGIPVLLKDNIDTRGLATTAGSRALLGTPPSADATLVARLRQAGAVVLGKANLSEWANFRSTHSTSGWSGVGGQTNNPYALDRNPCGSSSGSGAGIAASLAQVAIGTETDGSIVCPAAANGIVGHKPSLGLVSRTGVVPLSLEQDTAGPMARNVEDVALTLSVLQGRDRTDAATLAYPSNQPTDYARALRKHVLRGARIGVWRNAGIDKDVDRIVERNVALLRAQGATVVEVELPYQAEIAEAEYPALLTEIARDLPPYLRTRPQAPQSIQGLIDFNRRDPVELSKFGQELFEQAATAPGPTDPTYRQQRATTTTLARRSIDETLAAHHLDAIVAPTNSPAWRTDYTAGDAYILGTSTPAAASGYPSTTVPAGYVGTLPIGLSFIAGPWADTTTLALAAAFERANPVRRTPRL